MLRKSSCWTNISREPVTMVHVKWHCSWNLFLLLCKDFSVLSIFWGVYQLHQIWSRLYLVRIFVWTDRGSFSSKRRKQKNFASKAPWEGNPSQENKAFWPVLRFWSEGQIHTKLSPCRNIFVHLFWHSHDSWTESNSKH